ncbi:6528_t:CDS:2 [Dentiscutata erythropus]|uniref:6528_t:CDS:1 n=1 Tax=Dentiscutata erythropus TaxID=1348616 RepID=A0A9N9HRU0_9GLOM|nr:6528_t:CDS:2 [Dentiscutata erythropus]
MVFGGLGLTQLLLLIAKCNLTLADSSASLNSNCGSPLSISINDPYPSTNNSQYKMYVWEFTSKTAPASIGNQFPSLENSCPSLPCNSGYESSSNQYYFVMAIKNLNSQAANVTFNVLWDIQCDSTPSNTTSNSETTNNNSSKPKKSDGSSKFGNIVNIYILTIVITIIIELGQLVA